MDKQDKPRLAEVLGVKQTEKIRIVGGGYETDWFCIEQANGTRDLPCGAIVWAINHPESIIHAPRLTEAELAVCRVLGAKWVSRDLKDGDVVSFWDREPVNKYGSGVYIWAPEAKDSYVGEARASLFPSVKPGDFIRLEV